MVWFSDLYGLLFAPLPVLIFAPIVFFVLAFIADALHDFIHWLEDSKYLNGFFRTTYAGTMGAYLHKTFLDNLSFPDFVPLQVRLLPD